MKTLTILTTTYNRGDILVNLFNSLYMQKEFNFKWLIIDDGSMDKTKEIVKNFKTDKFEIKYIYKENHGKHTALNLAFKYLDTELVIIVDSDDMLVPDATLQITKDWKKYKNRVDICGLVYVRKDINGKYISEHFKKEEFEDNYNSYIINKGIRKDKAEVFRCDILKKYKFPEFDGENFIGEGVLWSKIARNYNMIFIDKAIYICQYLNNGLTNSGRKLRIENPYGGMFHAEEYMDDKTYSFRVREKNTILYMVYAKFAGIKFKDIIKKVKNKYMAYINILPSMLIYIIWKKKYK